MDSLRYMPYQPSEEMLTESRKALRASGVRDQETLSWMVARMLDGINNINESETWTPRGKLIEAAREMSAYLAIEEGRNMEEEILRENPEIGLLAKKVASESEKMLQETIARLEKAEGGEAIIEIIREQGSSEDAFWLSSALFRLFFHIGSQASAFWEKVPPMDQPIELLRGQGIAAEIRIMEDLSDEAFFLLSEWDDRLNELHALVEEPNELIAALTEEISENEIDYLFGETEIYESIVTWAENDEEVDHVMATQLALRLHKRAFPEESPLPDIF